MNTKKFFYGLMTFAVLSLAACSSNSSDELYDGVEKEKIEIPGRKSVEKEKIVIPGRQQTESVEKDKIIINKD